jgi:hypothetical protein
VGRREVSTMNEIEEKMLAEIANLRKLALTIIENTNDENERNSYKRKLIKIDELKVIIETP